MNVLKVFVLWCVGKMTCTLVCWNDKQKEAKEHDEHAVGTLILESSMLVGHVLLELSFLIFTFIRAHEDNQVMIEVTEGRKKMAS